MVSLTKEMGKFFAPKSLRNRLSEHSAMKSFLGIYETTPELPQFFKPATKVRDELTTDVNINVPTVNFQKIMP